MCEPTTETGNPSSRDPRAPAGPETLGPGGRGGRDGGRTDVRQRGRQRLPPLGSRGAGPGPDAALGTRPCTHHASTTVTRRPAFRGRSGAGVRPGGFPRLFWVKLG